MKRIQTILSHLPGARVTVMGLGLHGGGLAVAQWFQRHGARVCVTDLKTDGELAPSITLLEKTCRKTQSAPGAHERYPIRYVLGRHEEEDFRTAELVIQNPGVPLSSSYLDIARAKGVPIENKTNLFFLFTSHIPKIAVTGTRGKSTTASLIAASMREAGVDVRLVGVAGIGCPTAFDILDELMPERSHPPFVVIELSSWELELFHIHKLHPRIAVVTNLYQDHLNRHGTMALYTQAKSNIFRFQSSDECVVLNHDLRETREFGTIAHGNIFWFSSIGDHGEKGAFVRPSFGGSCEVVVRQESGEETVLCNSRDCVMKGRHTLENVMAATSVGMALSLDLGCIRKALTSFQGLPGRLECISSFHGRTFVNDTTATSPDGVIAAVRTLCAGRRKKCILIAGGTDKRLSFRGMAEALLHTVRDVVLLPGDASELITSLLRELYFDGNVSHAISMVEAVELAWSRSQKGDTIVLSPGAASFGMFANEFDRGAQFCSAVRDLIT